MKLNMESVQTIILSFRKNPIFLFTTILVYAYVIVGCTQNASTSMMEPIQTSPVLTEQEDKGNTQENAIGSTSTRSVDGMTMVFVPEGEFIMGLDVDKGIQVCREFTDSCSEDWFVISTPVHNVSLDAFWIDKTEVTNKMYALCVESGVCTRPSDISSRTRPGYYISEDFTDYPVIHVTWNDANTYCQWVGGRLPTEAEWEKAARGVDGRIFPWGDAIPNYDIANFWDPQSENGDTVTVGSYPEGASPYGALDMAGNVWEWVSDYYSEDYSQTQRVNPTGPVSGENRVVRGGSWHFAWDILTTLRLSWNPDNQIDQLGFRCVMSVTD